MAGEYLQAQTTTGSRAEAMQLARDVVSARLAACAQVAGPVTSTYWWNDAVEQAEEWLIFFKLPAEGFAAFESFVAGRHCYDEPEIIATPIQEGSAGYLGWVREETRS